MTRPPDAEMRSGAGAGAGAGAGGVGPEPVPPEVGLRVGDKVGPYRLTKLLGEGTSGRVFEVEHEKIGRRAAMKTLSIEQAARPGAVKRLFTEALAVNRINNPHIVEVTDLVEGGQHHLVDDGRESVSVVTVNALVMELLEGHSLAQAMIGEGPMPPERFLPILAQVAEALAAAHAAGFIHRDLKPENIFLIERGGRGDFVKLLDFGLTKTANLEPKAQNSNPALATLDGTFLGTPGYVSPEQASGKGVDHRTDIYALGVVLFELVCGRLPFEGHSVGDYIVQHLTAAAPHLPDEIIATKLGRTLDAIVQRCMAKRPGDRFPSAAQLAEIFSGLAQGQDVDVTAMSTYLVAVPSRRAAIRRRRMRAALGVWVGLSLGILVSAVVIGSRRASLRQSASGPAPAVAVQAGGSPSGPRIVPMSDDITITFQSEPPGAEVRLVGRGEGEPLGVTPFQRAFRRGEDPLMIEVVRAGFETARIIAPITQSGTVSASLRPLSLPRKPRFVIPAEKTIDPFQ